MKKSTILLSSIALIGMTYATEAVSVPIERVLQVIEEGKPNIPQLCKKLKDLPTADFAKLQDLNAKIAFGEPGDIPGVRGKIAKILDENHDLSDCIGMSTKGSGW